MAAPRHRVLIAGAGVAGLEAALALRRHGAGLLDVELLAPTESFVYRPLLVAEPFGVEASIELPLARLAEQAGAGLRRGALAAVDPARRVVTCTSGEELAYDSLLVAPGATPREAVPGAITFGSAPGRAAFGRLLDRLGTRGMRRVAFVVPRAATWSIAAYELALLTAAELDARGSDGELVLVTHERTPLAAFGADVSATVATRLEAAGVELRCGVTATGYEDGALAFLGGGAEAVDGAVALPGLVVEPIEGLPQRRDGFIPTDVRMHVSGLEAVLAAGDSTAFPIKQGGIAAQQADVAARAIAARGGAHAGFSSFRPVLRAVLITGGAPEFLRAHSDGRGGGASSREPLWWPPEKIAGRYLAPLLAAETEGIEFGELIDLEPPDDPSAADAESDAALSLLLAAADADARSGAFERALDSLALAERLDFVLPAQYVARRDRWRHELDPSAAPSAAGVRVDPALGGAELAINDLRHRIGRLREIERETGGRMRGDLRHLDDGLERLRRLSIETGLMPRDQRPGAPR